MHVNLYSAMNRSINWLRKPLICHDKFTNKQILLPCIENVVSRRSCFILISKAFNRYFLKHVKYCSNIMKIYLFRDRIIKLIIIKTKRIGYKCDLLGVSYKVNFTQIMVIAQKVSIPLTQNNVNVTLSAFHSFVFSVSYMTKPKQKLHPSQKKLSCSVFLRA